MTTQRNAFPEQVPRPVKRRSGRTASEATPVNIRTGKAVTLDDATHEHIKTHLGRKLAKFALRIERTTVRFTDVNGPRGGLGIECQIKVVLSGLSSVVVEERGTSPREAFDLAADAAPRAVRRSLGRAEGSAAS